MRVLLSLISGWYACVCTYVCLITVNPEPLFHAIHFDDLHVFSVPATITARLNIQLTDTPLRTSSLLVATQISIVYNTIEHIDVGVTYTHARTFPVTVSRDTQAGMGTRLRLDESGCESLPQKTPTQPPFIGYKSSFLGVKLPGREVYHYICYTDWSFSCACLVYPGKLGDSGRLKYSGMWHCVPWRIVPEMPSSSGPSSPNSLGLFSPEEESPIVLRNAGNSSNRTT